MTAMISAVVVVAGCDTKKDFKYLLDEFADLKVMRYTIPGWDDLTLKQKEYAYHLSEAAKYGRDILWDQNCRYNIPLRHAVESILENYGGDRECPAFKAFTVYAKRLFFANGIHHHYSEDKFFPGEDCPREYFASLLEAVGYPAPGCGGGDAKQAPGCGSDDNCTAKQAPGSGGGDAKQAPGCGGGDAKQAPGCGSDDNCTAKQVPGCGGGDAKQTPGCDTATLSAEALLDYIYDPESFVQRRSTASDGDIVENSSVNFYEGVTRDEVESYYASIMDPSDRTPIAYGLNTKVVKDSEGRVVELPWCIDGIYAKPIAKICEELALAAESADSELQKEYLHLLIEYYRTGDLRIWDEFNVAWVKDTVCTVDFINGFIEDYNDPLGRKGAWEGYVNIKDNEASARTQKICQSAQWFEDNAPIDPRFRKEKVKGVSAKVVNAVCLAGDSYPATPIGINLPNADWIRRDHGSKSVTIANITHAYSYAAQESPASTLNEFAWDQEEIDLYKKYGSYADEVHTDLHECLGHGSGQLLEGVSATAMGEYSSTLEEARADLFGLYFAGDPKLVELGIMPSMESYKAEYSNYIRNGLMVQFSRVELGKQNTEAHMQNRQLIAQWCYENGDNVIEKRIRDGKTYFVVNDYEALRGLFARLLAEIQRIKSEGDYAAGKALVEKYAVNIDPDLHREVLERYQALNLKPYGGFINPDIVPVVKKGRIVDYAVKYNDDYLAQQLLYGRKYGTLD